MNFKKIAAASASLAAAAALSVSAGAALVVPDQAANGCDFGTGNWMVRVFCPDMDVDYGIDWSQLGSYSVTIKAADPDWFEGGTGGALYVSCGPTSITPADHNWVTSSFWGVIDDDLELETQDTTAPVLLEKVGDYTYKATLQITDDNCVYPEVLSDASGYIQIGIQEWGNDMSEMEVVGMETYDKSGNLIASFDGYGNITIAAGAASSGADTATVEEAAPAADVSAAATAGDTTAAVTSSKGSPDTGIADVAAAAGIAVVAAGAVVIAKKRK